MITSKNNVILRRVSTAVALFTLLAALSSPLQAQALLESYLDSRFADNGGVQIHYRAAGEGPLVLLIHGFGDYSETWRYLLPELTDSFRVVAIDSRGVNFSDSPGRMNDYSLTPLLEDILAVAKAETDVGDEVKFTLIGHDLGAAIAWQFAFTYPEMLTGLVALSMPHPASYEIDLQVNPDQRHARALYSALLEPSIAQSLTPATLAAWVEDDEGRAAYIAALELSGIESMLHYLRNIDFSSSGGKPSAQLIVNLPLLLIHGEEDAAVLISGHEHTFEFVSADSAMLSIPSAGHRVHHDAKGQVNGVIRNWLDLHRADISGSPTERVKGTRTVLPAFRQDRE